MQLNNGTTESSRRISNGGVSGLLSINEAAEYLGLSAGTMRNWLSMRRIEYVKVGRLTRVPKNALDRFIAANTVRAQEDAAL